MKIRMVGLAAAVLSLCACGKGERTEAVTLCQVLSQKQAEFAATNSLEKDLLGSTRSWAESIISNGAGKGKGLSENAASARELSKSASSVSAKLGELKQAVYDHALKEEYVQGVRSTLVNALMKRQKMLQEVRTALEASATNFLEFQQSRGYTGETYPAGIDKLNNMLSTYMGPDDTLAKAIAELKTKYQIQDADMAVPASKS